MTPAMTLTALIAQAVPPPSAGDYRVLIWTTVCGTVVTVVTILSGIVMEYLKHQWATADREAKQAELKALVHVEAAKITQQSVAAAQDVKVTLRSDAAEVAKKVEATHAETIGAIAQNTEVSTKAFEEANKVNEKIATVGMMSVAAQSAAATAAAAAATFAAASHASGIGMTPPVIQDIRQTGEDTNQRVRGMEGDGPKDPKP
jgi:hypothetical protein